MKKSSFPYLVDVCITHKCDKNCHFCYMDSTKNGKHADPMIFWNLTEVLREANVFEVVLGGGEPSIHPNFSNIVDSFKSKGFNLSVTTNEYDWWLQKSNRQNSLLNIEVMKKNLSSIAFSCNSLDSLAKLKKWIEEVHQKVDINVSVQMILGLLDYKNGFDGNFNEYLMKYLESASSFYPKTIVLLQPKTCGRADEIVFEKLDNTWINILSEFHKKNSYIGIGVDAGICHEWKDEMIKAGIKECLLTKQDGVNTCFYDAVEMKLYKSSYERENGIFWKPSDGAKKFLDIFQKL